MPVFEARVTITIAGARVEADDDMDAVGVIEDEIYGWLDDAVGPLRPSRADVDVGDVTEVRR